MANLTISQLAETTTATPSVDVLPIVVNGLTRKILLENILKYSYQGNDLKSLSANWDSVYNSVVATSGDWNSVYTDVVNTSAEWDSVYSSVLGISGNWNSVYNLVLNLSSNWDSVYTDVVSTSANWNSGRIKYFSRMGFSLY